MDTTITGTDQLVEKTTLTSGQLGLQLKIFDEKGMTPERWGAILSSGIFADLCDVYADLSNRAAVRAALKIDTGHLEVFDLGVNYQIPFHMMVADGHYDYVDARVINEDGWFRGDGEGIEQFEARLFCLGHGATTDAVIHFIKQEDVSNPWLPAQAGHLLAFGVQYSQAQRKFPVIGLHARRTVGDSDDVLCLSVNRSRYRALLTQHFKFNWNSNCRFLAVRKKTQLTLPV